MKIKSICKSLGIMWHMFLKEHTGRDYKYLGTKVKICSLKMLQISVILADIVKGKEKNLCQDCPSLLLCIPCRTLFNYYLVQHSFQCNAKNYLIYFRARWTHAPIKEPYPYTKLLTFSLLWCVQWHYWLINVTISASVSEYKGLII